MKKLNRDQWSLLDTLMRDAPDSEATYSATGWHYELMALLGQFGIRSTGRVHAFSDACKLLEMGWKND